MYRRLQVSPEASAQQILHAYRRLAHTVHPDTHPDDPDAARRFQEITEAYKLLSDPERRARYDRQRRPPDGQPGGSPAAVIRLGSVATSSAPLIAGPVRIEPASRPPGASPGASPRGTGFAGLFEELLDELFDELFGPWRSW